MSRTSNRLLGMVVGLGIVVPGTVLSAPVRPVPAPHGSVGTGSLEVGQAVGPAGAPTVVWTENFENGVGTAPSALNYSTSVYTGVDGVNYIGASSWLDPGFCNGLVVAGVTTTVASGFGTVTIAGRSCIYVDQLRQLAIALGNFNGSATPNANHAIGAFTAGTPGPGTQAQMSKAVTTSAVTNRFVVASVNSAAMNCGASAPSYQFGFASTPGAWSALSTAVNGCTGGSTVTLPAIGLAGGATAVIRRVYSSTSFLSTGSTILARSFNANGSGVGNDAAFDDLTIWDATPTISKAFSPSTVPANTASTMTITITNTTESASKIGWSFTDALPAGLKVANPTGASTTCPSTTFSPVAGSTSVSVGSGSLTTGMASCTITVKVVAAVDGVYANGADNFTSAVGLVKPAAPASLTVLTPTPRITLTKSASPTTVAVAGDLVTYTLVATNTGNIPLTNVSISDPKVPGLSCTPTQPVASLAVGATLQCSGSIAATAGDISAGSIANTASVSAGSSAGSASATASVTVDVVLPPTNPHLVLTKSVPGVAMSTVGQPVPFTLVARNDGDIELTSVTISDPDLSSIVCTPAQPATLAVGTSLTCQGTHVVTQADLDAGGLTNSASATGDSTIGPAPTATASASVTADATPALRVSKTVSPSTFLLAGEVLTYEVRVTNTGNVTLTSVVVQDPGADDLECAPLTPPGVLAPGQQQVCTARHTVTQADVLAGEVVNTANATADPDASGSASATATGIPQTPAISLTKTPITTTFVAVGDRVSYRIVAMNVGNVPLDDVEVVDETADTLSCSPAIPVGALPVGGTVTCLATVVVTQADVDAGRITNVAAVTAVDPLGGLLDAEASAGVDGPIASPRLSLSKSAAELSYAAAGDILTYTLVATNTGNVTLADVTVVDGGVTGLVCSPALPVAELAPSSSVTCTGQRVVTQAEVDGGVVSNAASAAGTAPDTSPVAVEAENTVQGLPAVPRLVVRKSTDLPSFSGVGGLLQYTVTITNAGTATVKDIAIDDPLGAPVCSPSLDGLQLAPGDTVACTYSHLATGLEATLGEVVNTASVSGTSLSGVPAADSATLVTPGPSPLPELSLAKQSDVLTYASVGQVVAYTLVATNTGNVPLADVVIVDDGLDLECEPAAPVEELGVGASLTCIGEHVVTQDDLDAGAISNLATARGNDLLGTPVTAQDSAITQGPPAQPRLTMQKSASTTRVEVVGSTIEYTFLLRNTGNVTITDVTIDDPSVPTITCRHSVLAPGDLTECTGRYPVTQADIDGGSIVNAATASGTPSRGTLVPAGAVAEVETLRRPALELSKTSGDPTYTRASDTISYTLTAVNAGNTTLTDVAITDPSISLSCMPSSPVDRLAPGDSLVCTGQYSVTALDMNVGSVTNRATATGAAPDGSAVDAEASAVVDGPVPDPRISVSKAADVAAFRVVGEVVTYTITVTNTGNVPVTDLVVEDSFVTDLVCEPLPFGVLAPQSSNRCTGVHVVTQSELDDGTLSNTADATARTPLGLELTDSTTLVTPGLPPTPALGVLKSATPVTYATIGDELTWMIRVVNTGTATLSNVYVVDTLGEPTCAVELPIAVMAPGEEVLCSLTRTVSSQDVESGSITNTASVSATSSRGDVVDAQDVLVTDGPAADPRLSVVKTARSATFGGAGSEVLFDVEVVNTGNVAMRNVTIDDPGFDLECDVSLPVATLEVGGRILCTATVVATQQHVDDGSIGNTVVVDATTPDGDELTAQGSAVTHGPPARPTVRVVKSSSSSVVESAGQVLTYTFAVTNTGNVTLAAVRIDDLRLDAPAVCDAASVAPGLTVACTGTYTVTAADLVSGSIRNTAVVRAESLAAAHVGAIDDVVVEIVQPTDPELPPTGGRVPMTELLVLLTLGTAMVLAARRARRTT